MYKSTAVLAWDQWRALMLFSDFSKQHFREHSYFHRFTLFLTPAAATQWVLPTINTTTISLLILLLCAEMSIYLVWPLEMQHLVSEGFPNLIILVPVWIFHLAQLHYIKVITMKTDGWHDHIQENRCLFHKQFLRKCTISRCPYVHMPISWYRIKDIVKNYN